MTSRYRLLPAADRDLDEQAGYLARESNLETALRFYEAADRTFQELARMPGLGQSRESAHPRLAGLRVHTLRGFPNHLAFYRPTLDGVEVVRVLHGARDIDRVLESGEG